MRLKVDHPSRRGSKMFDVSVVNCGTILELEVEWPSYPLDPMKFSGKWYDGTGDGTLSALYSRMTNSR